MNTAEKTKILFVERLLGRMPMRLINFLRKKAVKIDPFLEIEQS